jgi:hypothetical protein
VQAGAAGNGFDHCGAIRQAALLGVIISMPPRFCPVLQRSAENTVAGLPTTHQKCLTGKGINQTRYREKINHRSEEGQHQPGEDYPPVWQSRVLPELICFGHGHPPVSRHPRTSVHSFAIAERSKLLTWTKKSSAFYVGISDL